MPKTETKAVRLVLNVPPQFHRELKVYAAVHGLTMNAVVQRAFVALKHAEKSKAGS